MKNAICALKTKYSENPGWIWLCATVFLFPILPEYVSPFILFAGFIVCKRQWSREGRKAKVGTIGKIEMAFMSFALISALWSSNKLDTLGSAGLWWGMFLVQVMIYNLADTRGKIEKLMKLITMSAAVNGLVGTVQVCTYTLNKFGYIGKQFVLVTPFYKAIDKAVYTWLPFSINTNTFAERASGFYSNPNLLAAYMLVAYPISIYLFLDARTKKEKIFYFFMNIFITAGMSSTLTRAGCVFALFGWIFLFVILVKRHGKELLRIFIPTVAIILPSILTRYGIIFTKKGGSISGIVTGDISEQNTNFIAAQKSSKTHFEIWESVWDYITSSAHYFIRGLGFGCESTGNFLLETYNLNKPHAHNFVLEIWAELGIIGVVLLGAVIICAFGKLLEINANNGRKFDLVFSVFTSLMLLLLFGLSDYIFNSPKQIILIMILLGLTQAISQCYDKTLIKSPGDLVSATSKTIKEMVELT